MVEIDIGRLGELEVQKICKKHGFTINSSKEDDRFGWDLLVEFPKLINEELPLDKQKSRNLAMIQIKTTQSNELSRAIRLSNAHHMATQEIPTFIVLIHLDEKLEIKKIYIKHIWKLEIENILKRLRREHREKKLKLNEKQISIRFNNADIHTDDFANFIKKTIDNFGDNYANEKLAIIQNAGYDGNAKEKITFNVDGTISDLVDWQIGLRKKIKINNLKRFDSRFGIDFQIGDTDDDIGDLEITPIPKRVKVKFSFDDDSEIVSDAELFVPNLPGLPFENFKFRLNFEAIEFIFGDIKNKTASISINFNQKCSIQSLKIISSLLDAEKAGNVKIEIQLPKGKLKEIGGFNFLENSPLNLEATPRHIFSIIEIIEKIMRHSLEETIKFSYEDIESILKRYEMVYFYCLANNLKIVHDKKDLRFKKIKSIYYFTIITVAGYDLCVIFKSKVTSVVMSKDYTEIYVSVPNVVFSIIKANHEENMRILKSRFFEELKKISSMENSMSLEDIFGYISSKFNENDKFMYLVNNEYMKFLIENEYVQN